MATKETMCDVAYDFLSKRKKEVEFLKLWDHVAKTLEISEDKLKRRKAQFYSDLMLDSRFASLEGNKWDLRHRRKFEEVHVNTDDLSLEDEEDKESEDMDTEIDLGDDDNEDNRY